MDKQTTSILKKGQIKRELKPPIQYSDAVKGGEAMSSKSTLPHDEEAQKQAKVTSAQMGEVEEDWPEGEAIISPEGGD